jgi:hypothetical protein
MSLFGLTYSDFGKGRFELHSGKYTQDEINAYIDTFERQYLVKLLGADLYNLFKTDCANGTPATEIYVKLFEPFEYDLHCGYETIISDGIIEMLKGLIYWQYLKDKMNQVTTAGVVKPQGENSIPGDAMNSLYSNRYNQSVKTYEAIQRYILDNCSEYPTFNGKRLLKLSWF